MSPLPGGRQQGEHLSRYYNKLESVGLRKCPCDHGLINKAHLSAITMVYIFFRVFNYKMAAKSSGIDVE